MIAYDLEQREDELVVRAIIARRTICVWVATAHVLVVCDQDMSTMPSYGHGKDRRDISGLYMMNCLFS